LTPTKASYQQGMLPMPPYPDFSTYYGQTGGTAISAGGTVGFLDLSLRIPTTVQPTSVIWNFGGTGACAGATGATARNPLVSFGSTGSYTVTLTATNANGTTSITKTNFVTVS
jgi:PKD repeat protein